jgi:hypothetical protein
MTKEAGKLTREFCGRTASEIEAKFMDWLRETAGSVCKVEKHSIERLPPSVQALVLRRPVALPDPYSMMIEYEAVTVENEEPIAPKSNKKKKLPTRKRR